MTAVSIEPVHIPKLGRLWLWMGLIAFVSHVALAAYVFSNAPELASGGGGKVLGTVSIALGSAISDTADVAEDTSTEPDLASTTEPIVEPVETPPAVNPLPKPPKAKAAARVPPPVKTQPKPIAQSEPKPQPKHAPVTTAPKLTKPPTQEAGTPADTGPASIKSDATPTLGDGSAATAPGNGGAATASADNHNAYLAMLRARIEANRTYPSSARRAGKEGVTSIRLVIIADGSLRQANIVQSSGHFALDRAAKRMVQKAAPFPAPPGATFDVTVPVAFALR